MITKRLCHSLAAAWQPLLLAVLVLLLAAGGEPLRAALAFDREAIGAGQWWLLLSGHFVHLGAVHTLLNALGLLALALLCPQRLPPLIALRRLGLLCLGTGLSLYYFAPSLRHYVGLSGVLHGLFVLGLLPAALRRDRWALAALLYLAAKLLIEWLYGAPASEEAMIGGPVATVAHRCGVLVALAYGLAFGSFRGREAARLEHYNQTHSRLPL